MMNELLTAKNIIPQAEHTFACAALNLQVSESSIISLVGPQSSSKTTWLNTLMGFNAMAQGDLTLLDHDVRQLSRTDWLDLQKDISYVGKDSALLSAYTLMENILLPALYHKIGGREELTAQVYNLFNELGFDDRGELNELPAFVTPLLIMYTKLARALIVKPKLLFIADVYAELSPGRMHNTRLFLNKYIKKTETSIILTTSHLEYIINDSSCFVFLSDKVTCVYRNKQELIESDVPCVKEYVSRAGFH
ncbi:MAG: hypothetical protein DIZ80_07985 [endosymbiont of Galathealinum brachiosum]|uniref:ABC transporter domain-containing protein n=1 Tax=endosymbiont of Galathealinum brachiosum TaxID=2200906 RepID=A0A370DGU4_9GAMM|nr:MAG: hypothetical protein DIZ80_07985 [endosymbiont of Galathealinum brachiosum]